MDTLEKIKQRFDSKDGISRVQVTQLFSQLAQYYERDERAYLLQTNFNRC